MVSIAVERYDTQIQFNGVTDVDIEKCLTNNGVHKQILQTISFMRALVNNAHNLWTHKPKKKSNDNTLSCFKYFLREIGHLLLEGQSISCTKNLEKNISTSETLYVSVSLTKLWKWLCPFPDVGVRLISARFSDLNPVKYWCIRFLTCSKGTSLCTVLLKT